VSRTETLPILKAGNLTLRPADSKIPMTFAKAAVPMNWSTSRWSSSSLALIASISARKASALALGSR